MFEGSIVALVTPFTTKNEIDVEALKNLILWHIENKTDAVVCTGTTGECSTLSTNEKILVYKTAVETAQGKIKIIAGTGSSDTEKSYLLSLKAKEVGVDGILAVVPYYNKPTQLGIYYHFKKLADCGLPVIVYHHPGRTGTWITIENFKEIAQIKGIVAIKDASCDLSFITKLIEAVSIPVLSGDDLLTLDIIKAGGKGCISVLANVCPKEFKSMIDLSITSNYDEAQKILSSLNLLAISLFTETNPQCVKHALYKMNKIQNMIRLPLLMPSDENKKSIDNELASKQLI